MFYYTIKHSLDEASRLTRQAIYHAMVEFNPRIEDLPFESTKTIQYLRDNLLCWNDENDRPEEGKWTQPLAK